MRGSRFAVQDLGFGVHGLVFVLGDLGFDIEGLGFEGLGFMV